MSTTTHNIFGTRGTRFARDGDVSARVGTGAAPTVGVTPVTPR
jgi:hypothetical protein